MKYQIARFFYWLLGWKWHNNIPPNTNRFVLIALPHTSNWDFFYTLFAFYLMRLPVRFTIKDSYTNGLFGGFFKSLGAIGINRSPRKAGEDRPSMIQVMTELFSLHKDLILIITAEGTRARTDDWKLGFYHVARKANVPIALGYIDYTTKQAGIGKFVQPTGDIEQDMREIVAFYKQYEHTGKIPENFALDKRYI
jgi:1-acyl-sn-glycerol-3-phosphate acyltransferase